VSWTVPSELPARETVSCCFCGRRSPREFSMFLSAGWQIRHEYPVRYRCPRCRRRQEPQVAA